MSLFKPVVTSAGILMALSDVAEEIAPGSKYSEHVVTPAFRAGAFIGLIGAFVLALALIQLHNRQAERMGRGALVAALFAGFGTMLLACVTWSTAFLDPAAAKVAPALIDNTPPAILDGRLLPVAGLVRAVVGGLRHRHAALQGAAPSRRWSSCS